MRRRDVLMGGAVLGLGAFPACAPARPALEPGVMPPNMDEFLRGMDERMDAMNQSNFVREYAASVNQRPLSDAQKAHLEPKEKLFRGMLRTLYLTQTFRDLPEEAQKHSGMQDRMLRHMGEVDETTADVTGLLSSLDHGQKAKLQEHLRAKPDLAMSIGEVIDDQAAMAGVSRKRRMQLRSMMMETSFRFKNSPPGTVIDEYVEKAKRMTAPNGVQAHLAMSIASKASSDMFWQSQDQSGDGGTSPAPSVQVAPANPPTSPAGPRPGVTVMTTGGILMGVGVVVFGISSAVVAGGAFAGVFGVTVGALLFAAGLICLIVGALLYAAGDPPKSNPPLPANNEE